MSFCKRACDKLDTPKRAGQPAEDAFALPQNGEVSDTAKAQMAMADLSRYAAPSPFEWGLIRENAARGIPQDDPREAAIEAERQRLVAAGERVEWIGDWPSAAKWGKSVAEQVRDLEQDARNTLTRAALDVAKAHVSTSEGVKFDDGKPRFDLLPPDALAAVAYVLTYGALKYADRNWELGMDRARLRAARSRHENRRLLGETHDPETGQLHAAHEAACSLMELALLLRNTGTDTAANLPEHTRAAVDDYGRKAVKMGRVAAANRGAHRG